MRCRNAIQLSCLAGGRRVAREVIFHTPSPVRSLRTTPSAIWGSTHDKTHKSHQTSFLSLWMRREKETKGRRETGEEGEGDWGRGGGRLGKMGREIGEEGEGISRGWGRAWE